MSANLKRNLLPTAHDAELAAEASRTLSAVKTTDCDLRVHLDDGQTLTLPRAAAQLLQQLLAEMSQGNAVTLIPFHAELTTQEAADYLNVSRPYLIVLLKTGKIGFRMVGTHRRIRFRDVEAFRASADRASHAAMGELAAQSQALGLGY